MKTQGIIILLAGLLLSAHAGHAQDSLRHTALSFRAGFSRSKLKDEFQSPYTYTGTSTIIGMNALISRARGSHSLDASYSWGKVKSIVSPQANTATLWVDYDYLFRMTNPVKQKRFAFSAGPGVHVLTNRATYLPNIELPVHYFSSTAFLSATAQARYAINKKSTFLVQASLPLAGVVYRPDFEVYGKSLFQATSPLQSQLFRFKATYAYALLPTLHLVATYDFSYFATKEPRSMSLLNQGLAIGMRKTF